MPQARQSPPASYARASQSPTVAPASAASISTTRPSLQSFRGARGRRRDFASRFLRSCRRRLIETRLHLLRRRFRRRHLRGWSNRRLVVAVGRAARRTDRLQALRGQLQRISYAARRVAPQTGAPFAALTSLTQPASINLLMKAFAAAPRAFAGGCRMRSLRATAACSIIRCGSDILSSILVPFALAGTKPTSAPN